MSSGRNRTWHTFSISISTSLYCEGLSCIFFSLSGDRMKIGDLKLTKRMSFLTDIQDTYICSLITFLGETNVWPEEAPSSVRAYFPFQGKNTFLTEIVFFLKAHNGSVSYPIRKENNFRRINQFIFKRIFLLIQTLL